MYLWLGWITAVAILENVTPYMNSASYSIYKTQMMDFGYEVHETVLEGAMFGALENRKRMCAVAITRGIEFSFDLLEIPAQVERTVGEILDPIGEDDASWSEMAYLKAKEVRDAADGKGFKRQEVLASHTQVPTVTRGYNKRRSTDPMLVHPSRPELIRLFTHHAVKPRPSA